MFCSDSINSSRRAGLALVAGLLLAAAAPARAQNAGNLVSLDCPAPHVPDPCVELDARKSIDPGAGALTYRWNMGDGTVLTGPVASHCYATRGRFTVVLDVVVDATGEVRAAEKTLLVDLTNQPMVTFTASAATVRVGEAVSFDASMAKNPPCTNEQVVWDFRDGYQAQGRKATHAFRRPGRYEVRMALRGYGPGACPQGECVSRVVEVTP